jgi:hypothetical protein
MPVLNSNFDSTTGQPSLPAVAESNRHEEIVSTPHIREVERDSPFPFDTKVPDFPSSLGIDLPPEVSLAEAARIANCDKKTVIRYLRDGVLEWRNIAPPSSSRPTYRIKLESVLALRTAYRACSPNLERHREAQPLPLKFRQGCGDSNIHHQFKHVQLNHKFKTRRS